MKLFFMSDIHGSLKYAKLGIEAFKREGADYLILLGDIMYHGPRNALPEEYNPAGVADLLNQYVDKIIGVRGNCDAEVDQMLLHYPCMGDYNMLLTSTRRIFATHGHVYDEHNVPNLVIGDVLIHGHTHIPVAKKLGDIYVLNPGSVAIPKENHPPTYGVIENDVFYIKTMDREIYKEISFA